MHFSDKAARYFWYGKLLIAIFRKGHIGTPFGNDQQKPGRFSEVWKKLLRSMVSWGKQDGLECK